MLSFDAAERQCLGRKSAKSTELPLNFHRFATSGDEGAGV
jgi:hypothetical protein